MTLGPKRKGHQGRRLFCKLQTSHSIGSFPSLTGSADEGPDENVKDEGDLDPEDSKDPPPATVRTIVASPPSVPAIKADSSGIQAPVENVSTSVAASELSGAMSGDSTADSFQGPPDEGNHTDT